VRREALGRTYTELHREAQRVTELKRPAQSLSPYAFYKYEQHGGVRLLNGCLIEDLEFIGFINDDTIPVGRVHIGLLYNINVSNKEVYINETDKMTADWIEKSGLTEFYEEMETWSKIIFDFYIQNSI
jgi:hypothetical protein